MSKKKEKEGSEKNLNCNKERREREGDKERKIKRYITNKRARDFQEKRQGHKHYIKK